MTPQGARERTYEAQRTRALRRLVMDEWFDELDAEESIAGWERRAAELGRNRRSRGYWDEGLRWIAAAHSTKTLAFPKAR
jgi:hypothetical protein